MGYLEISTVILLSSRVQYWNSHRTGAPEKITPPLPPENRQKSELFFASPFCNAPILHTVDPRRGLPESDALKLKLVIYPLLRCTPRVGCDNTSEVMRQHALLRRVLRSSLVMYFRGRTLRRQKHALSGVRPPSHVPQLCSNTKHDVLQGVVSSAGYSDRRLDGLALRNTNRSDSRESICKKDHVLITSEQFVRIASNLRVAMFSAPNAIFAKEGLVREPMTRANRLSGHLRKDIVRARKRHINFEHINFLKVGTTLGQPAG